jgi:hypothetical protein
MIDRDLTDNRMEEGTVNLLAQGVQRVTGLSEEIARTLVIDNEDEAEAALKEEGVTTYFEGARSFLRLLLEAK